MFVLMTQVPGQSLSKPNFWSLSFTQRCEIREAFKRALMWVSY